MSSRIAVCGQPPVWTAVIRSLGQHAGGAQELGVLGRVDVVGHDAEPQLAGQRAAQRGDQAALAGADRPADTDPQGTFNWQTDAPSARDGWVRRARSRPRAGAGSGPSSAAIARAASAIDGARSASHPTVTAGSSGSSFSAARRDRRRVVVEREQRRVLLGDARGGGDHAERDRPRRAAGSRARPRSPPPSAATARRAAARCRAAPGSGSAPPTRTSSRASSRTPRGSARLDREARVGLGDPALAGADERGDVGQAVGDRLLEPERVRVGPGREARVGEQQGQRVHG